MFLRGAAKVSLGGEPLVPLYIVVDYPDAAVQWEDTVQQYTITRERISLIDLIRCERCAVGTHPACAIDYSEWPGKVGEPG